MIKSICKRGGIIAFSFFIALSTAYASTDITKEYTFKAKDTKNLSYEYDKEITEGFKKYKSKSATYQVIKDDRDSIKRSFKDKAPDEIVENGQKYKRLEQVVKDKLTSTITYNKTDEIPSEVEKDNQVLKLKDKSEKIVKENVNLPARFYGEPSTNIYKFNGKFVSLANPNSPIWSTFNTDVRAYLNLGNEYELLDGAFTTGYIQGSNGYYRQASYRAIRTTPVIEATYESEDEYTYIYAGKDKKVKARVIVIYELIKDYTPVVIGAGGLVLALAIAGIIFLLMKRRKKENEDE